MYTPVNVRAGSWGHCRGQAGTCSKGLSCLLTRSWLVELESSSGKGMYTAKAMQLAKIAIKIKISNGLR